MKVALLAAGLGSRLGPLTAELPKALIEVGGTPLLVHALRFAARLSPTQVVVVGGFHHDRVAAEVARRQAAEPAIGGLDLTVVENRNFRQGNILSLEAARPHLDDDFLLLNVDHIFRPSIAPLVAAPPDSDQSVIAFIDTDRTLTADDMKVERDAQGHIAAIAKTLTRFDCGYVGMTRVPRGAVDRTSPRWTPPGPPRATPSTSSGCWPAWPRPAGRRSAGTSAAMAGWRSTRPLERTRAEAALKEPGWD